MLISSNYKALALSEVAFLKYHIDRNLDIFCSSQEIELPSSEFELENLEIYQDGVKVDQDVKTSTISCFIEDENKINLSFLELYEILEVTEVKVNGSSIGTGNYFLRDEYLYLNGTYSFKTAIEITFDYRLDFSYSYTFENNCNKIVFNRQLNRSVNVQYQEVIHIVTLKQSKDFYCDIAKKHIDKSIYYNKNVLHYELLTNYDLTNYNFCVFKDRLYKILDYQEYAPGSFQKLFLFDVYKHILYNHFRVSFDYEDKFSQYKSPEEKREEDIYFSERNESNKPGSFSNGDTLNIDTDIRRIGEQELFYETILIG